MATAFIGNDVLDIGSRKARRAQRGPPEMTMMGTPGQFDLPNVADVSFCAIARYHTIGG